nr:MAG TPA: hypothetical protein [Caudoviricetes sp.]
MLHYMLEVILFSLIQIIQLNFYLLMQYLVYINHNIQYMQLTQLLLYRLVMVVLRHPLLYHDI